MGMKRSRIKYIMFCITIIFIMSTVTVFAQQQEDIRQQQVLKTWAEAYGEDGQRMQMMSDRMKKTYVTEQVRRANENTFLLLHTEIAKNVQLHDKLDVVSFELQGNDTIFYTLRNEEGKEYHQAEYVTMTKKGEDFVVENSVLTNIYDWNDFTPVSKQLSLEDITSSFAEEVGYMIYPPVVTITGAENIDREVLPLFLDHLEAVFMEGHSSYYIIEMLNINIHNVTTNDDNFTIDFTLQEVLRNYPRNPDTIEYIKKAKDSGSEDYKQLYKEYQQPFYANYMMRFSGNKTNTESFRMYTGQENSKGRVMYNWAIQQQFPELDADGTKTYLGTINGTIDDYGRMLLTINRKQFNPDTRGATEEGFFITAYGQQLTFPLKKDANITCVNNGKIELVETQFFAEAAGQNDFGRSRLFWFKVEDNYITEINEFIQE